MQNKYSQPGWLRVDRGIAGHVLHAGVSGLVVHAVVAGRYPVQVDAKTRQYKIRPDAWSFRGFYLYLRFWLVRRGLTA